MMAIAPDKQSKSSAQSQLDDFNNSELDKIESKMQRTYREGLKHLISEMKKTVDNWDSASYSERMQFQRNHSIALMVTDIVEGAYKKNNDDLTAHLRNLSDFNYAYNMYAAEKDNGIALSDVFLDTDQINAMVNQEVNGLSFSQRLYKDRNKLAKNTTQAILDGLWNGQGAEKTASRIRELYGASYNNAVRIARTESGRVQSQSTQKSYEDMSDQGIDMKKRWSATLSTRTRSDHAALDGQTVGIKDKFKIHEYTAMYPHGFGVAAEDINCRCSTVTIINGIEPELRRDQETGEMVQYMNYNEWAKFKETGKLPKRLESKEYLTNIKDIKKSLDSHVKYIDRMNEHEREKADKGYRLYSGSDHAPINRALRNGFVPTKYRESIKILDDQIRSNELKSGIRVNRFFEGTLGMVDKIFGGHEVGDAGVQSSYSSTTLKNKLPSFGNNKIVLDIPPGVGHGFYIDGHSTYSSEEEFLLPRGISFKIKEISLLDDGSYLIKAGVIFNDN